MINTENELKDFLRHYDGRIFKELNELNCKPGKLVVSVSFTKGRHRRDFLNKFVVEDFHLKHGMRTSGRFFIFPDKQDLIDYHKARREDMMDKLLFSSDTNTYRYKTYQSFKDILDKLGYDYDHETGSITSNWE